MALITTISKTAASAYEQGQNLSRLGRPADAIVWFEEALRRDPGMGQAALEAGGLCLWYGRVDEAERLLADALGWAASLGPVDTPQAAHGIDPGEARTALFAAIDVLAAAGINAFLIGGTALGCVRERGFIRFDSDIDLGALPGTAPETAIEALASDPRLHYAYHDVYCDAVIRVRFESVGGIGGDLFLYQQDQAGWWCGVQRGPIAVRWRDTPFALAEVGFLDRTVLIPDPVERYLTENYGNWRAPNPHHLPAFSAPNLIGGYGPMARCAAYHSICVALLRGNRACAAHLCHEVLRRDPTDATVAAIAATLA